MSDTDHAKEHGKRPAFPWMQITDTLLEQAGFLPAHQVMFSVDHRSGCIAITPDYDYRVAGRYMTGPEVKPCCKDAANATEQLTNSKTGRRRVCCFTGRRGF